MIIEYDVDLTRQKFIETGKVLRQLGVEAEDGAHLLGELENPCAVVDRAAWNTLSNEQLISFLFNNPQVRNISSYDGTCNEWFRQDGTWPATIDTLTHLRGQRESAAFSNATQILDVACGNGMAGIYAINKHPNITRVLFSDIQAKALETAFSNTAYARKQNPASYSFVGGDGLDFCGKHDVIIASAVPATPAYPGMRGPLNPLFQGVDLLEKTLRDGAKHLTSGGKLLLSHSSCGDADFDRFAQQYGARVDKVLYERDVLYRTEFLRDQTWVDFLVKTGGLKKKEDEQRPYWHTVRVKEISFD